MGTRPPYVLHSLSGSLTTPHARDGVILPEEISTGGLMPNKQYWGKSIASMNLSRIQEKNDILLDQLDNLVLQQTIEERVNLNMASMIAESAILNAQRFARESLDR
jgi:hypothetical protein